MNPGTPKHLSFDQLSALSPQAQRLYELVWIRQSSDEQGRQHVWLYQEEAERRTKLSTSELEAAQLEILRLGYVYIRHGEKQSKYKLVPPEKQIRRDHAAQIGQRRKPIGSRGVGRGAATYSGEGWSVRKETERQYKESPNE